MKTNITLETLTKAITWSVLSFIFFRLALIITNAFFLSSSDKDLSIFIGHSIRFFQ